MQDFVRAGAWKGILHMITLRGGDAADILGSAGLPPDILAHPNAYYPLRSLVQTIETAAKRLHMPDFGLRSGKYVTEDLGAISLAVINSPTARAAIETSRRYIHIHNPGLRVDLMPIEPSGLELVSLRATTSIAARSAQMTERFVSGTFFQMKAVFGEGFQPVAVRLEGNALASPSDYRDVFGMDPEFKCDKGGVVFETSALDRPLIGHDEEILKLAEARLKTLGDAQLARLSDKVGLLIRGFLPGTDYSITQVSSILGLHERTLQRRLRQEGASFEQIKDQVRKRRAEELMAKSDLPLTDIAFMLGYSESSTFSRKARDWFGMSPREYRRQLLEDITGLACDT